MLSEIKGPLALLATLVVLAIILYAAFIIFGVPMPAQQQTAEFIPEPPSAKVLAQLEKSRGFEVLISYTDNGFEPKTATLKRGESARFTNNSSGGLWVAAAGSAQNPSYPGTGDCGASLFDTCRPLEPREFWEFTFEQAGTWKFHNNVDKGKTGEVRVVVQ